MREESFLIKERNNNYARISRFILQKYATRKKERYYNYHKYYYIIFLTESNQFFECLRSGIKFTKRREELLIKEMLNAKRN